MLKLASAKVAVVGIGGVGSWAAEALARSGVGQLYLVDMDHVAESNINRQVHALESTLGKAKVLAMAERIEQIAPQCKVTCVDDFVQVENVQSLIAQELDAVIDACDQVKAKAAMVNLCKEQGQHIVVCGAAGGRIDPFALEKADIALIKGDPLIASLRARLRRDYGFSRQAGQAFGVEAIYLRDSSLARAFATTNPTSGGAPLACAGYGSLVTVTASMGFAAANMIIHAIVYKN